MLTTQIQPLTPGVLGADNLLSSADMSTFWNSQSYPNPRSRFVIVMTPNGSRVNACTTPRGTR
ncbi:hypothetical protein QN345_01735 [Cryobacterium sp. 10I1]|uniref:hypothetical protein n=1 Tax=unclassified Cryobacterium TaxID=2649013 RepID=UPI002AB4EB47|nr:MULTISPECIES: hypothetical protein [unclassified Cryobacterium]MDY7544584.1 hypothetical protein [Cryobacterium sp. 5B3]MEB0000079.1 hypothetical protein [Cryobacterium sp. RTS3]MEB0203160.1 hypothetical protein [Cryobacterium sp. 5I3]MEB0266782.1 hypothetical protein [Cryobacterium sp. 10I5]MEB0275978.1 hypothetical protein [Cryobacterium sp. 5B3]